MRYSSYWTFANPRQLKISVKNRYMRTEVNIQNQWQPLKHSISLFCLYRIKIRIKLSVKGFTLSNSGKYSIFSPRISLNINPKQQTVRFTVSTNYWHPTQSHLVAHDCSTIAFGLPGFYSDRTLYLLHLKNFIENALINSLFQSRNETLREPYDKSNGNYQKIKNEVWYTSPQDMKTASL